MINAIARLRKTADEYDLRARSSDSPPATKAKMIDVAARWHWLASKAAMLCAESQELNLDATTCADCRERCLS